MKQLKIRQSITNRNDGNLGKYLSDINKGDLLTAEEEINLSTKIHNGDKAALDQLISQNLRFVVSVAKQYQHRGLGLPDLISEGNIGLIKAANRFDHTKGFKFISFAVWWIRQSIILAIEDQTRIVRLPVNQRTDLSKVNKASLLLEKQLERRPIITEISAYLDLPEKKVAHLFENEKLSCSLDGCYEDTEIRPIDIIENKNSSKPDDELNKNSLITSVVNVVNLLPKREQIIIKHLYGIDGYDLLQIEDIALVVGLSKERTRQLKCKGIVTLNHLCIKNGLIDYFN